MLEGKAVVRESDMPKMMQSHAMELAYQALDLHEVSDCQSIAQYLKQLLLYLWNSLADHEARDGEVNDDNKRHVTANNMSESAFLTYSILQGNRKYATQHPTTIT